MPDTPDPLNDARLFTRSRVILTAAELDLFTMLHREPTGAGEIASALDLNPRAVTRLLDCLVGLGLLDKRGGRYRTTGIGATLSSGHPETVLPMVRHMGRLWESWSHLTEAVKRGHNPHHISVTEESESLEAFIGAMHVVGRGLSEEIAGAYDASGVERLLDIGGGSGTYTVAFLRRYPGLQAVLFDLPDVIPLAAARLQLEGLSDRASLVAGDFYRDELPEGCDLALLSAIIHQNGPEQNVELYRKIYRALRPGGTILIRDHVMSESRTEPPLGALFSLNMLVCTDSGDTYTLSEIEETLERAGFSAVKLVRSGPQMDCLVEARKSG